MGAAFRYPRAKPSTATGIWLSAVFTAAVFVLVGTLAAVRLHRHQVSGVPLHRSRRLDGALIVLAPLAVFARIVQARRECAALKASQA